MAPEALDALVSATDAKTRRLRMFMMILAALSVALVVSTMLPWYRFEYTSEWFAGKAVSTKPVIDVGIGTMLDAARSTESAVGVQNPQVSSWLNLPIVVLAPLLGVLVSFLGLWVRSAAITALGLLGHLFGWVHLTKVRWWFEQAPGRENWDVSRSLGQSLFWFALAFAVCATLMASAQAAIAYRSSRKLRIAKGEQVEESATELLVRLISRTALARTSSSASSSSK